MTVVAAVVVKCTVWLAVFAATALSLIVSNCSYMVAAVVASGAGDTIVSTAVAVVGCCCGICYITLAAAIVF